MTFEQAIAFTQSLLENITANQLSSADILTKITDLVNTENGARGFFVTYLTSENTLADYPSEEILESLRTSPEIVAQLLAKNLAMSAAMALTHQRNDNVEMAHSSQKVNARTANLIIKLAMPSVYKQCQELLESVNTLEGNYKDFMHRWGYDMEQRQLMSQSLKKVIIYSNN